MNNRSIKLILSSIIYAAIIIIAGASYAYFSHYDSEFIDESSSQKDIVLLDRDCDESSKTCLSIKTDFKDFNTYTKNIEISNKNDTIVGYQLVLGNLNNKFLDNEVFYVLKDSEGNIITSETALPSGIYDSVILYDSIINENETNSFELTFIYRNGNNINESANPILEAKINLIEE